MRFRKGSIHVNFHLIIVCRLMMSLLSLVVGGGLDHVLVFCSLLARGLHHVSVLLAVEVFHHSLKVSVCYHCGGRPTEVNACVLNSYMVYV